jgi:hypothetical protein
MIFFNFFSDGGIKVEKHFHCFKVLFLLTIHTLKVILKCHLLREVIKMRFAGVKELKYKTMDILKESEKEDIIITAYGKPMAVLHHMTEDDLADYLIENDPAFKTRIEEAFAEYKAHGGMTAGEMIRRLEKRGERRKI